MVLLLASWFVPPLIPRNEEDAIRDLERSSKLIGWTPASESDWMAREIFSRVNDERRERGLQPLAWNSGLAEMAQAWTEEMIATGYRHSPDSFRATREFAGTGENILMGHSDTGQAHVGWMESDGHRRNILKPEYTAIGIGVVCRNDGLIWATQIFGWPHGVPSSESDASPPEEPIVRRDRGVECR